MKWYGKTQFALFRIIFGLYLTTHFAQLIPVASEVFSNEGVLPDATILPGYGKLPLLIFKFDNPIFIYIYLGILIISSLMFMMGNYRRISSVIIFYGWMSLLNRNPLITNPSLGYIGWILLACSLIPNGERIGFFLTPKQREAAEAEEKDSSKFNWHVPDALYYGMWIIMGVSYTASGLHKLQCQSWLDGSALYYVLSGPLARQDNIIVTIILRNPDLIKLMTWGSLFLEISFLFLGTFYRTRKLYWSLFMGFHIGILMTVNFSDLTLGMIIPHLFTFDVTWFEFTKKLFFKYDRNGKELAERDINRTDHFNSKPVTQLVEESLTGSLDNISKKIEKIKDKTIWEKIMTLFDFGEISKTTWIFYAVIIGFIAILANVKGDFWGSIERLTEITLNFYWGFGILVGSMGLLMILERIYPDQKLEHVDGWWKWVIIINIFQLFSAIIAIFTWEHWLQNTSYFTSKTGFHLRDYVSPFTGGVIAYFVNQWLFYHWHKARHEVYILWILFHQFHHSPSRIEAITSFYKHPFEIMIDSQIMAILLYSVLGLSSESSIWLSIFSGFGEYFYHMNIKTPRIIGYFFQRPESHRRHHYRNRRLDCPNHSDFPIFDILGGTFENPEEMNEPTGFSIQNEIRRVDMLLLKDVLFGGHQKIFSDYEKLKSTIMRFLVYALVIWGSLNSSAFIAHNNSMKDIGFVTVSSPLPLVFSAYNGVETFATKFNVTVEYVNGTIIKTDLDSSRYNLLGGAYNRRNIYGAIFSHGPFFDQENLIKIRNSILHYAICDPGTIMDEFQLPGRVKTIDVDVMYRPKEDKIIGHLHVDC